MASRKMKNKSNGTILEITEHIITQNFWEYYVTKDVFQKKPNLIVRCLVIGDFTEIGDVSIEEIKPYIISRTENLRGVMPAPKWEWID